MPSKKKFHDPTQQAEGKASRWVNEPVEERHPSLVVHTNRPFNAEPCNGALQHMCTPKGMHYRRTHAPVPLVDQNKYFLAVEIENSPSVRKFSLTDLRNFTEKEVCVTMMCTGNRRGEFNKYGFTAGLPWANGSISTAKWKGCLLADVLNDAGIFYSSAVDNGYNFLTFVGGGGYHISIPLHKGMDRNGGDCILASIMNNEAIPRDHGAPLRVVVPGYVGARSVKWLEKIILMKNPVESLHQTGIAYKQLGPNYKKLSPNLKKMVQEAPPIDIIPVTSAITYPDNDSVIKIERVQDEEQMMDIRGYAYSGGGRAIIRVDVSIDNGKTWNQAKLRRARKQNIRSNKAWAWCQWSHESRIPKEVGDMKELNICCKAIDDQYNQQPHNVEPIWNVRGILNTSWGRTNVKTIRSRL